MTTKTVHWGYTGPEGPDHWGCLSEAYSPCSEGIEQSPVNIASYSTEDGPSIEFDYSSQTTTARNNGHTVYLDFAGGSFLRVGGTPYELIGVHYHSPGEHQLDGEVFTAELHLVHQSDDGSLAVVGLLFRQGAASPLVQNLLDAAPDSGESVESESGAASDFVPGRLDYFGYDGSLTTPPCSEGVSWVVMQSVGTVSQEQAIRLQSLTGGANNRPVQPVGERRITAVSG